MPPPFHAEHIGSFLRPVSLIETYAANPVAETIFNGTNSANDNIRKEAERSSISWVVNQQLQRGIRPITSGEYERELFCAGFVDKIPGFANVNISIQEDGPCRSAYSVDTFLRSIGMKDKSHPIATSKICYEKSPFLDTWLFLRSLVPQSMWGDCKFTLPSPTWHAFQLKKGKAYASGVYESDEAFFDDLALCYRKEIRTLYNAGLRNIQIDDPHFTFLCDERLLEGIKKDGEEPEDLLSQQIAVHNKCLEGRPKDLHIGVHLCRGNFTGGLHFSEGGYERVAARMFSELNYDTFYLEYDTERAGDFEPLRNVPKGKNIVLGVISTKECEMEDLGMLKEKVEKAIDVMAKAQARTREQILNCIAVSPQCGFSSAASGGGVGMTRDIMWDKLELVKKLAAAVFPEAHARQYHM
jgi:methionine synthase II (cobalamin-independent)